MKADVLFGSALTMAPVIELAATPMLGAPSDACAEHQWTNAFVAYVRAAIFFSQLKALLTISDRSSWTGRQPSSF